MRYLFAAVVVALSRTGAALADPIVGMWKTQVDDGAYAHVAMTIRGVNVCGTIARTFDASGPVDSDRIGKKLVWDLEPEGNGNYASGKIWQPSADKVYKSKMVLDGSALKVSGCVGRFCKK